MQIKGDFGNDEKKKKKEEIDNMSDKTEAEGNKLK